MLLGEGDGVTVLIYQDLIDSTQLLIKSRMLKREEPHHLGNMLRMITTLAEGYTL
jgi:hypothetical protein